MRIRIGWRSELGKNAFVLRLWAHDRITIFLICFFTERTCSLLADYIARQLLLSCKALLINDINLIAVVSEALSAELSTIFRTLLIFQF